jgi:uncharacterized protein DUF4350
MSSQMRHWLVFGVILVVTFGLALLVAGGHQRYALSLAPSSFNSSPSGTKAIFGTLQKLGQPVERWEYPWTKLVSQNGILVYADFATDESFSREGAIPPTGEEADALAHWVSHGNTLLYYSNSGRHTWRLVSKLLDDLDIGLETNVFKNAESPNFWTLQRKTETLHTITPLRLTEGVHAVTLEKSPGFRVTEGAAIPLLVDSDGAAHALWVPHGRGQVVFFSSTSVIDNEFLVAGDNLAFLLNLLRDLPEGGAILFDEYHHGYSKEFAMHDFLTLPVVKFAALQLALVGALVLYSQARRFGEPVPLVRETRRSVMEYAVALGDLYRRADTQLETLEYLYQHVRRELIDRHGLGVAATAAGIGARLGARPELRRAWEELASDCEQRLETRRLTRREFAQLARRIQEFRRQMQ